MEYFISVSIYHEHLKNWNRKLQDACYIKIKAWFIEWFSTVNDPKVDFRIFIDSGKHPKKPQPNN